MFDVNAYKLCPKFLTTFIKLNPSMNLLTVAHKVALDTESPIMVNLYYLGEMLGYTDEILKKIQSFFKFYGTSNMKNTSEKFNAAYKEFLNKGI